MSNKKKDEFVIYLFFQCIGESAQGVVAAPQAFWNEHSEWKNGANSGTANDRSH